VLLPLCSLSLECGGEIKKQENELKAKQEKKTLAPLHVLAEGNALAVALRFLLFVYLAVVVSREGHRR
jgi:hypothetical protein